MKYQLNKLWFNVKFPNQLFKLEEKRNDFFYNLWRKNESKMPGYEKKEDTGTHTRGCQWDGGFYGYRLKFWLFYGYRLIFFSYG